MNETCRPISHFTFFRRCRSRPGPRPDRMIAFVNIRRRKHLLRRLPHAFSVGSASMIFIAFGSLSLASPRQFDRRPPCTDDRIPRRVGSPVGAPPMIASSTYFASPSPKPTAALCCCFRSGPWPTRSIGGGQPRRCPLGHRPGLDAGPRDQEPARHSRRRFQLLEQSVTPKTFPLAQLSATKPTASSTLVDRMGSFRRRPPGRARTPINIHVVLERCEAAAQAVSPATSASPRSTIRLCRRSTATATNSSRSSSTW